MAGTHSHSGCSHHSAEGMSTNRLKLSLALTLTFVVVEAVVGWQSGSLALLSDSGHNFTDALALGLSWYALWIAHKPASATNTYGYHRVGILTALFNAVTLILIAIFIFGEAWQLFFHPHAIGSSAMIAVAAVAFLMNTVIALALHGDAANDVNMRSAFIHMAGDALSSLGVVVAGVVIHFTHWVYADPVVSVLIGLFILYSSWGIVQETIHILLEGAPRDLNMQALATAIRDIPGVTNVHDLHVWTIGDGMNALSCHLTIQKTDSHQSGSVVRNVKQLLMLDYNVTHSTIETECEGCENAELYCQITRGAHHHNHSAECNHSSPAV